MHMWGCTLSQTKHKHMHTIALKHTCEVTRTLGAYSIFEMVNQDAGAELQFHFMLLLAESDHNLQPVTHTDARFKTHTCMHAQTSEVIHAE